MAQSAISFPGSCKFVPRVYPASRASFDIPRQSALPSHGGEALCGDPHRGACFHAASPANTVCLTRGSGCRGNNCVGARSTREQRSPLDAMERPGGDCRAAIRREGHIDIRLSAPKERLSDRNLPGRTELERRQQRRLLNPVRFCQVVLCAENPHVLGSQGGTTLRER